MIQGQKLYASRYCLSLVSSKTAASVDCLSAKDKGEGHYPFLNRYVSETRLCISYTASTLSANDEMNQSGKLKALYDMMNIMNNCVLSCDFTLFIIICCCNFSIADQYYDEYNKYPITVLCDTNHSDQNSSHLLLHLICTSYYLFSVKNAL